MLNAWPSIRNLGEVIASQFLLLFEAERAMVGGNNLQVVSRQAPPQRCLVLAVAQGRRHHIFSAFEALLIVEAAIQKQVLRTGLRERGQPVIPGGRYFIES